MRFVWGYQGLREMESYNKETGHAILEAARLDVLLQQLLLHAMPRMSNGLAKDLFDNGALGTFSAKIDLSRAMGLIDDKTRSELRTIKKIRNLFAHAETPLGFTSPVVFETVKKLPLWRKEVEARMVFDYAVHELELTIDSKISALLYEHATGQALSLWQNEKRERSRGHYGSCRPAPDRHRP